MPSLCRRAHCIPDSSFIMLLYENIDRTERSSIAHRIHFPAELLGISFSPQCTTMLPSAKNVPAIAARNAARTIMLETFLHSLIGIRWNILTLPLIFYSFTSCQNIPAYRRLQISSGHPCAPRPCSLNTSSNFAASDFYLNYTSRSPHLQLPFPFITYLLQRLQHMCSLAILFPTWYHFPHRQQS